VCARTGSRLIEKPACTKFTCITSTNKDTCANLLALLVQTKTPEELRVCDSEIEKEIQRLQDSCVRECVAGDIACQVAAAGALP
jgi:hypothetical protein